MPPQLTSNTKTVIPRVNVLTEAQREFAYFFLNFHILHKDYIPPNHKVGWASYVAKTPGFWHEGYQISSVWRCKNSYVVSIRTGGSFYVRFDTIEKAARRVNSKVRIGLSSFPARERARVIFDHLSLNTAPELVGDDYRCNGISNQAYWTRDNRSLYILGKYLLPKWKLDRPMNVASVGCSIGVEPTSLLLFNWEQRHRLRLTGYEIHYDALDEARTGQFKVGKEPLGGERKFFDDLSSQAQSEALQWYPVDNNYEQLCLSPEAKNAITYVQADILAEPLPMLHDVIYLRYVIMHFNRKGKIACINNVTESLNPGGVVVLNSPQDHSDGEESRLQTIRLFEKAGFIPQTFAEKDENFHWYDGRLALKKPE